MEKSRHDGILKMQRVAGRTPTNKIMTYRDLKSKLSELSDNQLDQQIWIAGEGIGVPVGSLDVLEEDMINPTGDGMEPVSLYKDDPEILALESIVGRNGDVFLTEYVPEFD